MQVHDYNNPTNRCAGCGEMQGCCDSFNTLQCDEQPYRRCDNEFFFCLRPVGTPSPTLEALLDTIPDRDPGLSRRSHSQRDEEMEQRAADLQCMQPPAAIRSDGANQDGLQIDFTRPTFLTVPNPIEFQVNAITWEVSHDESGARVFMS